MSSRWFAFVLIILGWVLILVSFYSFRGYPVVVQLMLFFLLCIVFGGSSYELSIFYKKRKSNAHYFEACAYFQALELEKAEFACEQAFSMYHGNKEAEKLLKEIKEKKAEDLLFDDTSKSNELSVAWNYYKLGKLDEAVQELEKFSPTSEEALRLLQQAKDTSAEQHFKKGKELYEKTSFEEAEREFNEALKFNPHHADASALTQKAQDWKEIENTKKALDQLAQAKEKYSKNEIPDTLQHLTRAHQLAPNDKNIESFFKNVLAEAQAQSEALYRKAKNIFQDGKYCDAKKITEQALLLFHDDENLKSFLTKTENALKAQELFEKSKTLQERGESEEAIEKLKNALQLHPDFIEARAFLTKTGGGKARELFALAVDYEKTGRLDEASQLLNDALYLCPHLSEIETFRLTVLQKKEALALLAKAKEAGKNKKIAEALMLIQKSKAVYILTESQSLEREIQDVLNFVEKKYADAMEQEGRRNFSESLKHYETILNQCVDFKDTAVRHAYVQSLRRPSEKISLELYHHDKIRKQFVLLAKPSVKLGRNASCDIVIREKEVSREHALLLFDGKHFVLEDLKSKNGTIVDGEKISKQILYKNHVLEFSDIKMKFVLHAKENSRSLQNTADAFTARDLGKTRSSSQQGDCLTGHLSYLENVNGEKETYILVLNELLIGRDASNDIILDDPLISRTQCIMSVHDSRFYIQDFQSLNGTYINGRRIESKMPLLPGDTVQFDPSGYRLVVLKY